jgi:hypothetical protein
MASPQLESPFIHIKQAFSVAEITQLKAIYADHAPSSGLPCYAFLDKFDHPLIKKLSDLIFSRLKCQPLYLNDFFFSTGDVFSTPWHVDTELFIFQYAVNAWILLEPSRIDNPLGFVAGVNEPGTQQFQSCESESDQLLFIDFTSNDILEITEEEVESRHIRTPLIEVGDLLLIDPMRFHRTNTSSPKGACVFKFVYSDTDLLLRDFHLPSAMWPEIGLYKSILDSTQGWDEFLAAIANEVFLNGSNSPLISGFYPDNFAYLVQKATELTSQ